MTRCIHRSYLIFITTYGSDESDEVWVALADRTRRAIVMRLAEGERAVGELAAELPISQPAVSQHLKLLKDLGLVNDRADGTRRIYRLNAAGVLALRDQLDTFWQRTMAGFTDVVAGDSLREPPAVARSAGATQDAEENS